MDQCRIYSDNNGTRGSSEGAGTGAKSFFDIFSFFFKNDEGKADATDGAGIIYVPGSVSGRIVGDTNGDKAVVAVLGMAHVNGIVKLIKEERVD
mmetsp:Transcript_486/g.654  ORF Transcript_486/g.654 Transcript_486/m.654 type:complete len:94 (+) Transcript_486:1-282(+)